MSRSFLRGIVRDMEILDDRSNQKRPADRKSAKQEERREGIADYARGLREIIREIRKVLH